MATPTAEKEQFLLQAFSSFAEAANSLERSYGLLRAEVMRLSKELEDSNSGLVRSLEENRRMRQHLDRVLAGLPCGVLVVADDGEISDINPEGRRLLGMHDAGSSRTATVETAHESISSFSSLRGELRELLERARGEDGEQEQKICEGSEPEFWLAARCAAVPDSAPGSSVFILRDVSDRKRLEEAQVEFRREQALSEMSTVLAHEVRNPLGSLELFAGLLAETKLSDECQRWVEHIQVGLRTLAATVNNVLHFHGPLHNPQPPEPALVDLGPLLDWAGDFFAPLARQSRVRMILRNRLTGTVMAADPHGLEQVLSNVVLNALHAMPGGGLIELAGHTIRQGRAVSISITDTGPGIRTEHLGSVFEPGFSTRAGSPGLGLAVCRKIVEQHGGTIEASSRPAAGATFTLTFPLAQAASMIEVAS
jgi:nitrogen fixation/metabolism regulation signal transduction histidine kinase